MPVQDQYHVAAIGQLCCEAAPFQQGWLKRVMNILLLGVQSPTVFVGVTIACFSFQDCVGMLCVLHQILSFTCSTIQEGLWHFNQWLGPTASLGGKKATLPAARTEGVVFCEQSREMPWWSLILECRRQSPLVSESVWMQNVQTPNLPRCFLAQRAVRRQALSALWIPLEKVCCLEDTCFVWTLGPERVKKQGEGPSAQQMSVVLVATSLFVQAEKSVFFWNKLIHKMKENLFACTLVSWLWMSCCSTLIVLRLARIMLVFAKSPHNARSSTWKQVLSQ